MYIIEIKDPDCWNQLGIPVDTPYSKEGYRSYFVDGIRTTIPAWKLNDSCNFEPVSRMDAIAAINQIREICNKPIKLRMRSI